MPQNFLEQPFQNFKILEIFNSFFRFPVPRSKMVLFSKDNYPRTHAVLERLNIKSYNAEGGATIPNLSVLFQKILKSDKETFTYFLIPMFLETLAPFYPNACSRVALNEYLYHFFGDKWDENSNLIIYRVLQHLNKWFLRSAYGAVSSDEVSAVLETNFSGLTHFVRDMCPPDQADPVRAIFSMDRMFELLEIGLDLDFNRCFDLIDLSIECKRQAEERKNLYDNHADPHPDVMFGRRKNSWFSQLVYTRIGVNNYHVSFVSSIHFVESLDNPPMANPWETTVALNEAFIDNYELQFENESRKPHRPSVSDQRKALTAAATNDEPGMFEAEYDASEDELNQREVDAAADETLQLVNLITHPEYVMPLRIRSRMPSGPYRVCTDDELDLIAAHENWFFQLSPLSVQLGPIAKYARTSVKTVFIRMKIQEATQDSFLEKLHFQQYRWVTPQLEHPEKISVKVPFEFD